MAHDQDYLLKKTKLETILSKLSSVWLILAGFSIVLGEPTMAGPCLIIAGGLKLFSPVA